MTSSKLNPDPKSEEWKYFKTKYLTASPWNWSRTNLSQHTIANVEQLMQKYSITSSSIQIVLVNGKFQPNLSRGACLKGVHVSFIAEYMEDHLFTSIDGDGVAISIDPDTIIEPVIQVFNVSVAEAPLSAHQTSNYICIGSQSQAHFQIFNVGTGNYLNNLKQCISTHKGSSLHIDQIYNQSLDAICLGDMHVNQYAESQFVYNNFSLGAQAAKYSLQANLLGENAHCDLNGLYIATLSQSTHHQLTVNHQSPNCSSRQLYKGILHNQAVSEFTGLINVSPNSCQTDAFQLNRNLLLSPKAKAHTRPQLQIDNDDVKCSHGASTGQLNNDQLLYCQSRGISESEAHNILIHGFMGELTEKILCPSLKENLLNLIEEKIMSSNSAPDNNLDKILSAHEGGKMEILTKNPVQNKDDLATVYTPGVAKVCEIIAEDVSLAREYTIKKNTIAVLSDGSAILGLGNLGPEAAMPVMEGKAILFKDLGGVDAFPICIKGKSVEEILNIAQALEPTFGGFNLEDISAPRCFEIERRLQEMVNVPVFHDDQHGTAVVTLAALYNALKLTGKQLENIKIVVLGAGAAAIAVSKIIINAGAKNIILVDRIGAIYQGRQDNMNQYKEEIASLSNPNKEEGKLSEVIHNADVFIGLSGGNLLNEEDLKNMNIDPIIFAMSNPTPEIDPAIASMHAAILATGRSDFPNQINNVLCFPGFFRGLLDAKATTVTENMKVAAAQTIADLIGPDELHKDYIIPDALDTRVAPAVAKAIYEVCTEAQQ